MHIASIEKLPLSTTGSPLLIRCKTFLSVTFVIAKERDSHDVYSTLIKLCQPGNLFHFLTWRLLAGLRTPKRVDRGHYVCFLRLRFPGWKFNQKKSFSIHRVTICARKWCFPRENTFSTFITGLENFFGFFNFWHFLRNGKILSKTCRYSLRWWSQSGRRMLALAANILSSLFEGFSANADGRA